MRRETWGASLSDFVERHRVSQNSIGYWAKNRRETYLTELTPARLMWTRLYLLASEVFATPYRPDVLRAPICRKFFDRGPFTDLSIDERMADLADAERGSGSSLPTSSSDGPRSLRCPCFSVKPSEAASVAPTSSRRPCKSGVLRGSTFPQGDERTRGGPGSRRHLGLRAGRAAQYSDLLRRQYGGAHRGPLDPRTCFGRSRPMGRRRHSNLTAAWLVSLGASVGKTAVQAQPGAPLVVRPQDGAIGTTIRAAHEACRRRSKTDQSRR
jgi:hypothetical protein